MLFHQINFIVILSVECLKTFMVKILRIEQNIQKPQNFHPLKLIHYTVAVYLSLEEVKHAYKCYSYIAMYVQYRSKVTLHSRYTPRLDPRELNTLYSLSKLVLQVSVE